MKHRINSLILFVLSFSVSHAQQTLTLQAAIDKALYNNLGLVISRNEAKIADNNLSPGNAGMLPRLDVNAGANYANTNINQKLSTGTEINKNGVGTQSFNGQLVLNWTLFDGTKMFVTYQKLEVLKEMGELNIQLKAEEIILNVIKAYSEIVKQTSLLKGTLTNLSLYQERVNLADMRLKIGKANKTELLQATVDLNVQKSNLARQTTVVKNAKLALSSLLMLPLDGEINVEDSLPINSKINYKEALISLETGNSQLLFLRMVEKQRLLEVKEIQSNAYPRVNFNAGYNFVSNSSAQGLFLVNQSRGPLVGLTLNWNLYNGIQKKQVENSKLLHENTKLLYQDSKNTLETMVVDAWQRYNDAMEFVQIENQNAAMANENLSITMQRFKLGEATILELKDAQLSSEASVTRLANTLYEAKMAETELLFLTGGLTKQFFIAK